MRRLPLRWVGATLLACLVSLALGLPVGAHKPIGPLTIPLRPGYERLPAGTLSLPALVERHSSEEPLGQRLEWPSLALLAVIGAGVLSFVLRASGRRPAKPSDSVAHQSRRKPRSSQAPEPSRTWLARYCHQCGNALHKNDAFCRWCGTRRRGAQSLRPDSPLRVPRQTTDRL